MAEHFLGHEGSAPEEGEGQQHKARQSHQLELDDGDEDLDGEDEEGQNDDQPGYEQDHDLDEVGEQADRPQEIGGRIEERRARIETGGSDRSRFHEIRERHAAARSLEAKASKALEQNGRKMREVADDPGEDADVERLLHQPLQHVLVGAPGPEQGGDGHVDDDEGRGQEPDFAAKQAEAGIDVAGEDREEAVDHAGIVHGRSPSRKKRRRWASQAASQPASGMVSVRQRRRSPSSRSSGSVALSSSGTTIVSTDGSGRSVTTMLRARNRPPSVAAITILPVRLIPAATSIAGAKAPEALAPFGFGRRIARGIERLGPTLRCDRRGQVGELLRLQREELVAGLGCLKCARG